MELYTLTTGQQIEVVPVSQFLLDSLNKTIKLPDKPKYKIVTASGAEEWHDHNETTLGSDEDRAAWAKYQEDLTAALAKARDKMLDAILLKGIRYNENVAKDWMEVQEYLGIELPTNPIALKLHYIRTELLASVTDFNNVVMLVMKLVGIPEEYLQRAEDSFQRGMASLSDTVESVELPTGKVESQQDVPAAAYVARLEDEA